MADHPPQQAMDDAAFAELATRYLDGVADDGEMALLAAALEVDASRRERLVWLSYQSRLLAHEERPLEVEVAAEPVIAKVGVARSHRAGWWAVAAAVLIAGVAAGAYLAVFNGSADGPSPESPVGPAIAVMIESDGVVWHSPPIEPGEEFPAGPMRIESGQLAFRLDRGAEVAINGPAEWRIAGGNSIHLLRGTLHSVSQPGFTVHAPHDVRIVDLGTEFEATVIDGRLTVRVLDGAVEVIRGVVDATAVRHRLEAGQRLALVQGAIPDSATLDLADVIGGGDGWGSGADAGVRLIDGKPTTAHREDVSAVPPANTYIPADHAMIDGVFVPDGGDGSAAVPVSSTGLTITGLADGDGRSWDEIWNGFNARTTASHRFDSVIGMHASKGATFDLDAIRHANPGLRVDRFTATAAMGGGLGDVTMYVAVDGVVRFTRPIRGAGASEPIDLPLAFDARFLTLITVSNGLDASDWAMFGDPTLTLTRTPDEID